MAGGQDDPNRRRFLLEVGFEPMILIRTQELPFVTWQPVDQVAKER